MKRKLYIMLMALVVLMFFTACGSGEEPSDAVTEESVSETDEVTDQEEAGSSDTGESETKEPVGEKQVEDGKYQGSSMGMQGPLTAEITVKDNRISSIEFLENSETPTVTKVAFERIPAQIIEGQSLKMDVVTGATLSSHAILKAVEEAAEVAGLDVDAMKVNEYKVEAQEPQTVETDVLVVGGGEVLASLLRSQPHRKEKK